MAKSSTKKRTAKSSRSTKATVDKIAKAAMSREMLGAGLAAAAAAISASPSARRKIRDAGLDAADSASQAATNVMASASRLGTLIAEAVADAAQRVMSGKWTDDDAATSAPRAKPKKAATKRKAGTKRKASSTKKPAARALALMMLQTSKRRWWMVRLPQPSFAETGRFRFACGIPLNIVPAQP